MESYESLNWEMGVFPDMSIGRQGHTAVMLDANHVMVVGGKDESLEDLDCVCIGCGKKGME